MGKTTYERLRPPFTKMKGLYLCIVIDKCHLACMQHGFITYPHGRVADGTRCTADPDDFDVCIEGKCRVQRSLNVKFDF